MSTLEGLATNRAPLFDGSNYAFLSVRMKTYIMSLGFDVYMSLVNGYTPPSQPPTDPDGKRAFENNAKAMNAILCGLSEFEFVKVMHCESAQTMWEKLQNAYERDERVKNAKLQTHRMLFEDLKMREDENIAAYFLRVDEVVNSLKGLGETLEDKVVVPKISRSLPPRFDAKVSTIEEMEELDKLMVDKLHGISTAYEMRTNVEISSKKETTFKASKKGEEKEQKSSESSEEDIEDEAAHLVRKLKRGSGKYKGKLPLRCFNCGKIGHFASKCPYEIENDSNDEKESRFKNNKKFVKRERKFRKFKRSLYSKEDNDPSPSSEEKIRMMKSCSWQLKTFKKWITLMKKMWRLILNKS